MPSKVSLLQNNKPFILNYQEYLTCHVIKPKTSAEDSEVNNLSNVPTATSENKLS